MKKCISLLIVVSLLVLSGAALAADNTTSSQSGVEKGAQHKSGKPRVKFEDCDKGNKGFLTFEEAQACFPKMKREKFDAIDANKDGRITKEELKVYRAARKKERDGKKKEREGQKVAN